MSAIAGSTASPGYSRRSCAAVWLRNVALTSIGTYSSASPVARIASRMIRLFSALPAPSSTSVRVPSCAHQLRHPALEQRALGAGGVVLGQPGDRLEQLATRADRRSTWATAPSAAPTGRRPPPRASAEFGPLRAGRRAAVRSELGIAGAPEAAEDLAADGVIPVAEGVAHRTGPRGPRAAAEDLVLGAEEDLGVLLIGKALEAGPRRRSRSPSTPTRRRSCRSSRSARRCRGYAPTGAVPKASWSTLASVRSGGASPQG